MASLPPFICSLECLKWLVQEADGDPYITAKDGMSAIHAAAQGGRLACLQWLVEEAGVPIRLRGTDGATPAHFAAANGEVGGTCVCLICFLVYYVYMHYEYL